MPRCRHFRCALMRRAALPLVDALRRQQTPPRRHQDAVFTRAPPPFRFSIAALRFRAAFVIFAPRLRQPPRLRGQPIADSAITEYWRCHFRYCHRLPSAAAVAYFRRFASSFSLAYQSFAESLPPADGIIELLRYISAAITAARGRYLPAFGALLLRASRRRQPAKRIFSGCRRTFSPRAAAPPCELPSRLMQALRFASIAAAGLV